MTEAILICGTIVVLLTVVAITPQSRSSYTANQ